MTPRKRKQRRKSPRKSKATPAAGAAPVPNGDDVPVGGLWSDHQEFLRRLQQDREAELAKAVASPEGFREYALRAYDQLDFLLLPGGDDDAQYRVRVADQYRAHIAHLWRLARELGGADHPPPLLPPVETEAQAESAIDAIVRWVNDEFRIGGHSGSLPTGQSSIEQHIQRIAQAVGDENTIQILTIAGQMHRSGEDRMRAILEADSRFAGKDSNEWATLLSVSASAVRGYDLWKRLQQAKKSDA